MSMQRKFKSPRSTLALGSVAALSMLAIGSVHAETLGTKLYESTTLVTAPHIDLQALNISGAGTVTVKLTDMKWPDLLGTLSFTLFDATHTIGSYSLSPGALTGTQGYTVNAAGTYYASIFAAPASGKMGGLFNAQIYFGPAAAPVPLPASGWLMMCGIAALAAIRPKQKLSQKFA
jgi:hypothetical protein